MPSANLRLLKDINHQSLINSQFSSGTLICCAKPCQGDNTPHSRNPYCPPGKGDSAQRRGPARVGNRQVVTAPTVRKSSLQTVGFWKESCTPIFRVSDLIHSMEGHRENSFKYGFSRSLTASGM